MCGLPNEVVKVGILMAESVAENARDADSEHAGKSVLYAIWALPSACRAWFRRRFSQHSVRFSYRASLVDQDALGERAE